MLSTLTSRRERFLVAEIETGAGVERISRTLALDATAPQVRELLGPFGQEWDHGVLTVDPEPDVRLYVLPLLDGVIARWDLLLAAHRRRTLLEAAEKALAAMGEPPMADGRLADWLAAGAAEQPPAGGPAYVPAMGEPVTHAEWFGMERRAQLLARVLPIAHQLNPGDPDGLAHFIAARLVGDG
ncbi:MAG: hypothetical protein ACRD0A_20095 [Acidimicrobiales bacterium]